MHGRFEFPQPFVSQSDKPIRLNVRLKGHFATARRPECLEDSGLITLISLNVPLAKWFGGYVSQAFADGPTDAHRSQFARYYLKKVKRAEGRSEHIPTTRSMAALARSPNARNPN